MPARIIIVNDEAEFIEQVVPALRVAGHDVTTCSEPIVALDEFDATADVDLLITRVRFAPGKSHGVSLALMAKSKHRNLKVLFTADREFAEHVDGIGEFLPLPLDMANFLAAVDRLLQSGEPAL